MTTRARAWMRACTCTCHWSGTVLARPSIMSSNACGLLADSSTDR